MILRRHQYALQVDANNRSVFKMNDKMSILTEWLRTIGRRYAIGEK